MTLDLSTARTVVADHLDDADGDRWSSTKIDLALAQALSQCVDEYLSSGGDRFDEILTTTSTTSGLADLSSIDPLVIKDVMVLQGNRYWPIKGYQYGEQNIIDDTARDLKIRYVRKFVLPTNTSHKIVGNGATAANSWDAFDHWICVKAALFCATKDAEARPELVKLAEDMRYSVMSHTKVPKAVPFPSKSTYLSSWYGWVWNQNDKDLVIIRAR